MAASIQGNDAPEINICSGDDDFRQEKRKNQSTQQAAGICCKCFTKCTSFQPREKPMRHGLLTFQRTAEETEAG